jgi:hypothetical protein
MMNSDVKLLKFEPTKLLASVWNSNGSSPKREIDLLDLDGSDFPKPI